MDYVLIGLNVARPIKTRFANFHDARPIAKDYKLRHALRDTPLWGAYMTDVIKDLVDKDSNSVRQILKQSPQIERHNIDLLRKELDEVGANNPTLIALGKPAYAILRRHLGRELRVVYLPHYSMYISKEDYRESVYRVLEIGTDNKAGRGLAINKNQRRNRSNMRIHDNESGQDFNYYPHTVRANGLTCPKYVELGNSQSCVVIINGRKTEFHVWKRLDSDRVNFEIDGQWYFIDNADLNRQVRDGTAKNRKFEFVN